MVKAKTKEFDIALKKQEVSKKHIEYYDKVLELEIKKDNDIQ